MTFEERFEKLERELAAATRRNRWTLSAAVLVLVGLVTAHSVIPPADGFIARRGFIVTDEQGRERIRLAVNSDQTTLDGAPALEISDAQGICQVSLEVRRGSPYLSMHDAQGRGFTQQVNAEGKPELGMFNAQERPRHITLDVGTNGNPVLIMRDDARQPDGVEIFRDGSWLRW
ncbi:MAG: hypothetical protein FJ222_04305 [Lentisphaerae bacterium]|nr:hypothetical protein [Lentisphaerota bacterium]